MYDSDRTQLFKVTLNPLPRHFWDHFWNSPLRLVRPCQA